MAIRNVTTEFSAADQITADDVAEIAQRGFKSVICNRPDGEAPDQPDYATIEEAAKEAGLEIRWQPVISGQMTDEDGLAFRELYDSLPKPLLAYCRTGTRSTALWSLSQAGRLSLDEIVTLAGEAGYNMAPLAPRIAELARQRDD